jgi:hypothetical protein
VLATIDIAVAWGWFEDAAVARRLLDRILAMLWKLPHFPQAYTRVGLIHAAMTIAALADARDGRARAWA